jgi:ABC-2 type transport system permease protein
MIATIARKEFIELFRDGRFRWASAIVLALLVTALVAGAYYQRDLVKQQRAAQAAEQARWYEQDSKNPHSAAHYGLYAFKPRLAPAFLDPGVEPYTGIAVWLEAHKQNEMIFRPSEDATVAQRFGDLTVALVLQVLLPLVIIMLGFNTFAGERERGTLRQLLSVGLRPRDLVTGKMLGFAAALALIAGPAVLLGAAILALIGPAGGELRFMLLAVAYLLYLGIYLFLTLAVSARASSSRLALVGLLAFWAVNCLIAPRVMSDLAAELYPLPEGVAFKARLQAALHDPTGPSIMMKDRTAELLRKYSVTREQNLPLNLAGLSLQVGEDYGYVVFGKFYNELYAPMEAQNRVLQIAAVVFPQLSIQAVSMGLAGTDLDQYRDFARAAEEHRRAELKIINDDILEHPVKAGEMHLGDHELWAKVPAFQYQAPAIGWVLSNHALTFILLALWFSFAACLAWTGATRLRPV